ncbi:MAG: hypothetical protein DDT32_01914 [Syntrophomonadaceae bacterium]|nr:hypothetical protein [Bacillota bacterium]
MNNEVTFQAKSHTYTVDGKRIPSVSQILEPLQDFSNVDPITLMAAQEFGRGVHSMTALWDQGTLDEEDLDIGLIPYLQGWRKFLKQTECEIYEVELAVHHEKYGYAGRLDRLVYLKRGRRRVCAILDIKTGEAQNPVTGVQLAGYHAAYTSSRKVPPRPIYRVGVRLLASGDYRLDWWESKLDWPTFLALLQITNWRRVNGISER